MKVQDLLKKYAAYLVAAVLFVGAAVIYCFPATQGKTLGSSDSTNAICAASEAYNYHKTTGETTWWTNSMYCGMPSYQIYSHYKADSWLSPLRDLLHKGHGSPVWILIIYFFCFFVMMRSFGIGKWLSIAGSFAVTLSSYFIVIIAAGHNTKTSTIALMSVVLAGFILIMRKKYGLGAVLTMLFMAAGFTSHPQMSYYVFLLIGVLWLAQLAIHIKEKRMKDFAIGTVIFVLSVGVGALTNSANIFANAEFAAETIRGGHSDLDVQDDESEAKTAPAKKDIGYATNFSYGYIESFSLLIPGVTGGATSIDLGEKSSYYKTMIKRGIEPKEARSIIGTTPMYWGGQPFTAGNVYVGAIICFLFVLGLLIVRGPMKWGLLAATLFSVFLALGSNFMPLTKLFFNWFPFYNKFRAVSSILIVAELTMPILGMMAIQKILDGSIDKDKILKSILIAGGVTGAICIFFSLVGPYIFSFQAATDSEALKNGAPWAYNALIKERKLMMSRDALRSLGFIFASAVLLWFFTKGKLKKGLVVGALGVLIVLDMVPVDRRYFNYSFFEKPRKSGDKMALQPWEKTLLDDHSYFRVLNTTTDTFNEARTSLRFNSLGGYNAAKLRRYQDIINECLRKKNMAVIGMLNTKYLIIRNDSGEPAPFINNAAFGNAWFVNKCYLAANAREEMDALSRIDLRTTAVLDDEFKKYVEVPQPPVDPDRSVKLVSHSPKALEYVYETRYPANIIFSEIYYPHGWKVTIDGQKATPFRADYILRGLSVPAGHHTIKFVFDPDSVRKGDTLAMIFIILMYAVTAGVIGMGVYRIIKRRKDGKASS